MPRRSLLLPLLLLVLSSFSYASFAAEWQQPTPDELKMTAEPAAPNADAVYLYREDITDNKLHMESVYVRMKILRDEGKKYGDVEIAGISRNYSITDIQGRTIHSDGSIVPFTGKPFEKLIAKTRTQQYRAEVFSLPDVQTGSILEYRYKLRYDDHLYFSPEWSVQTSIYTRKARFQFTPTDREVISKIDKGGGTDRIAFSQLLPAGAAVKYNNGAYELNVEDIRGLPREEFEPPMNAFAYRVRFYYTNLNTPEQYWNSVGKSWAHDIDRFAAPSSAINDAARELTAGAATPDEKLNRLYDAVMKLDNTRYSREHSQDENKAEGVKRVKTAADVLALKRGSADDLAMLFLALARAAGFHAEAMGVVNRNRDFFQANYLDLDQLDDLIVLVTVDGKERVFDPGERYMTYGQLYWTHAMASGLREKDGKTALATTPANAYKDTVIQRYADVTLAPDGAVTGDATIVFTGQLAARWRQRAVEGDQVALNREFDDELRRDLPPGLAIHADHFLGLDTEDSNLLVRAKITGSLATATGKRLFLPLSMFTAGARNPFAGAHREEPIDLRFPYLEQDKITLHLPPGYQIESVPEKAQITLPGMAGYAAAAKADGQTLTFDRQYAVVTVLYPPSEYDKLKGFFDDVSNKDRAQAVLHVTAASPAHTGQ